MSFTTQQGISPPLNNPGGAPVPGWVPPPPILTGGLITPEAPPAQTFNQTLAVTMTATPTLVKQVGKLLVVPTLPQEYYTFDGGTNGNTIATSDTGNGTAFDTVTIGTGAAFIYDNAHFHSGSLAGKVTVSATQAAVQGVWAAAFPDVVEAWARLYVYFTGLPNALVRVISFLGTDGGISGSVEINSAGKLRVFYRGVTGTAGTTTIPLNQWVRIGLHVLADASVGVCEAKIFTNPESDVAAETVSATNVNTGSQLLAQAIVGHTASIAATSYSMWIDDAGVGTSGWLGPSGVWTPSLTAMKVFLKTLAVGLTATVTIGKAVGKALSVSGSWVATMLRAPVKPLNVTVTFTATMTRRAGKVLSVALTATPTFVRSVGKVLAVGTSWGVSVLKSVGKKLSVSGTWTATVVGTKAFLKTLSVTVTYTVAFKRTIGKKLVTAGSWIATILGVKTVSLPSYFLPPVVEFLHSKDRFVMVTNEKDEQMPSLSAQWRYRGFYKGPVAQQRLTDPEGYYTVGAFQFRGGYWNGPLSGAEKAAIQAAGLGSRIRTATEPGLLPASID